MTLAVADAGPMIHLSELGVREAFTGLELLVPPAVSAEIERGGALPADLAYKSVAPAGHAQHDDLDRGERAALALAAERDALLLTDDMAAREAATERGVEVRGSVGLIVRLYARGDCDHDTATTLLRDLQRETSLFISDDVIERGIALLDDRATD